MAGLSVSQAAERLGVNKARVRALLAAGQLAGTRVGAVWVVDDASVAHREETKAGLRGRPFSARTAWAAGALLDGLATPWLTSGERSRLRSRLRKPADTDTYRQWLRTRGDLVRYRIARADLGELLARADVVAGGVSATSAYGLGLGHGTEADAYADADTAHLLRDEFFLVESERGNLALRVVQGATPWHRMTARSADGGLVAPRLIVAADLLDSDDTRSRSAGARLLAATLEGEPIGNDLAT